MLRNSQKGQKLNIEITTRAEAVEKGFTTYFTGKPCKYGHVCARQVHSGNCSSCRKILTARWRSEPKNIDTYKAKEMPSVEYLQSCFDLVEDRLIWKIRPLEHFTNVRSWKVSNNRAGDVAGHYNKRNKYLEVRLDGKLYKGHRIVYKMFYGMEPTLNVDHIDGNVSNNHPLNLRLATHQENSRNAIKRTRNGTSEYKGVQFRDGFWFSILTVDDVAESNMCKSEIDAAKDYDRRAIATFKEFAQLNFPKDKHDI